jgi:hypothetical protein
MWLDFLLFGDDDDEVLSPAKREREPLVHYIIIISYY